MRTEGKRDVYSCNLPLFISVYHYHHYQNERARILAIAELGK